MLIAPSGLPLSEPFFLNLLIAFDNLPSTFVVDSKFFILDVLPINSLKLLDNEPKFAPFALNFSEALVSLVIAFANNFTFVVASSRPFNS